MCGDCLSTGENDRVNETNYTLRIRPRHKYPLTEYRCTDNETNNEGLSATLFPFPMRTYSTLITPHLNPFMIKFRYRMITVLDISHRSLRLLACGVSHCWTTLALFLLLVQAVWMPTKLIHHPYQAIYDILRRKEGKHTCERDHYSRIRRSLLLSWLN